ncbi:Polypeptide N-acetylgalactosaminyltransferase-like 6 [Acipenser ruthenus]|uniref:Polypeptide N-acetylgalactosaminyltransferase-like 6 n=1 Tax=Acipenser ruthenus TaxID=7906 RepID=A0A444U927_ACIRT|nr:Polypeptide N-acetylgalactosaminyltransferase-like 6 [Acipenser ruthenus]
MYILILTQHLPPGRISLHLYFLNEGVLFHSYTKQGKGEHGKPYPLTEEECDDSAYRENGFNIYVSNNIALDRSLPDIRHPKENGAD